MRYGPLPECAQCHHRHPRYCDLCYQPNPCAGHVCEWPDDHGDEETDR